MLPDPRSAKVLKRLFADGSYTRPRDLGVTPPQADYEFAEGERIEGRPATEWVAGFDFRARREALQWRARAFPSRAHVGSLLRARRSFSRSPGVFSRLRVPQYAGISELEKCVERRTKFKVAKELETPPMRVIFSSAFTERFHWPIAIQADPAQRQ